MDQKWNGRVPICEEGGSSPCPKGAETCRHGGALEGCDWPSRACRHQKCPCCYQQNPNHHRRKGQLWNWKRKKSGDEKRVGGLDRRSRGCSPGERGRARRDSFLSLSRGDCVCFPVTELSTLINLQTNGEIQSWITLFLSSFHVELFLFLFFSFFSPKRELGLWSTAFFTKTKDDNNILLFSFLHFFFSFFLLKQIPVIIFEIEEY